MLSSLLSLDTKDLKPKSVVQFIIDTISKSVSYDVKADGFILE